MIRIENCLYDVQLRYESSVPLADHLLRLLEEGFFDRLLKERLAVRAE